MKRIIYLAAILLIPVFGFSQTQKFEYTPKVKQRVEITNLLGPISLINTNGNTLGIESDYAMELPERAKGLQPVGASEDNTGHGINLTEDNGVVYITGVTKKVKNHEYTISIPEGMNVSLDYNSPFANGDLSIDSYKGSLEVKSLNANVKISNATGPLAINTVSGKIEVSFNEMNQNEPTSLATVSGQIDVYLPKNGEATVKAKTMTGEIVSNLKAETKDAEKSNDRSTGLKSLNLNTLKEYKLNGGGIKLSLNSVAGNINLKKL
jgi:predicted membrane protein